MSAKNLVENIIPVDGLAGLNEDGSTTKLVIGPVLFIAAALGLIAVVRLLQRFRERRWEQLGDDD